MPLVCDVFSSSKEEVSITAHAPPANTQEDIAFYHECLEKEQEGDAVIWANKVQGLLCYDSLAQTWRIYENGIWKRDELNLVFHCFGDTVREDLHKLAQHITTSLDVLSQEDPHIESLKRIDSRRRNLGKRTWVEGALKFAQSHPALATSAVHFDAHPHLLAVENAVVDFDELIIREHRPEDQLTMQAPVTFEQGTTCPIFDAFLHRAMGGDEELVNYVWRAMAYSVTGYVNEDVLFFCYGKGANGKSTFNNLLKMLCGQLMTVIDVETLLSSRNDGSMDYKKAMLEGKRVVITDEIPENRRLNESMIKSLLGGEDILARRPYEKPYQFTPTHKIWMVGNHKPTITGTDHGIWRRIHMIPWLVTVPEKERRPRHVILAEFRSELPGILNRLLEAWDDYTHHGGLRPPPAVLEATKEYHFYPSGL